MQLTGIVGDTALWAEKDKDGILNYTFDLASQISDGDRVVSCDWTVLATDTAPVDVTRAGQVIAPTSVTIVLTGGTVGVWFNVTGTYRTELGLLDQMTLRLYIRPDAEVESPLGSALFGNRYSAVLKLKTERLANATRGVIPAAALQDDYLWDKLRAAEAEVARKLGGLFLQPTEVFSIEAKPEALAAIGSRPYVIDPGYDLPPDFFRIGQFGMLKLNRPLVSKVTAMSLHHPSLGYDSFVIPPSWVLLVGKYGLIQVMPAASHLSSLPVSLFALQAMGAGCSIPQMVRVQYTAGLSPQHELFAEVVDAAQRAAVVSVLSDAFVPQSGSISADGLSQSVSNDISKHQEALDAKLAGLQDRLVGPVWGVL